MKKEQEAKDNVLPFERPKLALAGKEPPEGTGKNWLVRLPQGTRFLAKQKSDFGSELKDFVVLTDPKTMDVVLLGQNVTTKDMVITWRDPVIFSNDYRYYLTLEVLEPNNGNTNKIPTEPVASDVKSEVIPGLHEEE